MSFWDTLGDVASFIIPAAINPFNITADGIAAGGNAIAGNNTAPTPVGFKGTAGGAFGEGQAGYTTADGGVNQLGVERPDYLTARNMDGDLAERFKEQMGGSWQALRDKGMTQGDTVAAGLQRQGMQNQYTSGANNLAQQQAAQLAQARGNMGMRGGVTSGARERMSGIGARAGMNGMQGLGQNLANQNLNISMQDEANKNNLLQNVGNVEQQLNTANTDRLFRDVAIQNAFMQGNYKEDMGAYAAEKTAEAMKPEDDGDGFLGIF